MRERRRKFTPPVQRRGREDGDRILSAGRRGRRDSVNEGTLGNWVHKYRVDHAGEEPPLSISERSGYASSNEKCAS